MVTVGDAPLDPQLEACVAAGREAMVNAAKYAADAPVSVYAEIAEDRVEVFVKDRGPGFDLDAVAPDRMGVRGSILGRMARHGGQAEIRTGPGEGTEVRLTAARRDATAAERRRHGAAGAGTWAGARSDRVKAEGGGRGEQRRARRRGTRNPRVLIEPQAATVRENK